MLSERQGASRRYVNQTETETLPGWLVENNFRQSEPRQKPVRQVDLAFVLVLVAGTAVSNQPSVATRCGEFLDHSVFHRQKCETPAGYRRESSLTKMRY